MGVAMCYMRLSSVCWLLASRVPLNGSCAVTRGHYLHPQSANVHFNLVKEVFGDLVIYVTIN